MAQALRDKVVAVTGGFGILGRAVGEAAIAAGAKVALIDRARRPDNLSASLAGALALGEMDIATAEGAGRAIDGVVRQLGGVDGLVAVAGGFRFERLEEGDLATWDLMYTINLKTAVATAKAALPLLLARQGRIVTISAGAAMKSGAGMGAYAASKAGVARFTESLSEEVKKRGMTVNAILPSIIDTPQNRADMPKADFSAWVRPEEIADAVVFLLSPQASAITGALIPISGRV